MKHIARVVIIGLIGLVVFIVACSRQKDYSKNFSTPNDAPISYYDIAKYEKGVFTGAGWSADKEEGAPLKKVLVYVDGKAVGEANIADRPDVANAFKDDRFLKSGWLISARIPLDKGAHSSMVLSYDSKDALKVVQKEFIVK
ncbi:MAG: repeat-associated core domain protein [Deltaproteobacteria bacterium]|nr:repeat-associated core domain protein [Deltaproteobacteria bacterium]